jgi:hypothetical protein
MQLGMMGLVSWKVLTEGRRIKEVRKDFSIIRQVVDAVDNWLGFEFVGDSLCAVRCLPIVSFIERLEIGQQRYSQCSVQVAELSL